MLASLSLECPVGSANILCALLDLTHNLAVSCTLLKFNLSI